MMMNETTSAPEVDYSTVIDLTTALPATPSARVRTPLSLQPIGPDVPQEGGEQAPLFRFVSPGYIPFRLHHCLGGSFPVAGCGHCIVSWAIRSIGRVA